MEVEIELLSPQPKFPNGYGVSSPKKILKGRYILFSENKQAISLLPRKVRTAENGPTCL